MQRLKVPGGALKPHQWQAMAEVVREFTPDAPLHVTTRQDIEFHNLTTEQIPFAQAKLAQAGLSGAGGCGDTLRNITICTCSGLLAGCVDLHPLAMQIQNLLLAVDGIYAMPRKFKVNMACGEQCGRPWINDLGLIAKRNAAGELGFTVIVAGSLGAKPGTGMLLHEWLPASDVLPLATALIDVFAAHGDRENRRKARLRHVRERMGDEAFAALVAETFAAHKARPDLPALAPLQAAGRFTAVAMLTFFTGNFTAECADALGRLAADDRIRVRLNVQQGVTVYATGQAVLDAALAEQGLASLVRPQAAIMTCPGTRWCKLAMVSTETVAEMLQPLAERLPAGACMCVSGCPNGCSHVGVADVGLSGVAAKDGQDRYNVVVGGGNGRTDAMATPLAQRVSADEAIAAIENHLAQRML